MTSSMISRYAMRQALLRAMRDMHGAPVKAEELCEISQEAALRPLPLQEKVEGFRELAEMGYLAPIEGFGGQYFRITRKGLEQLLPEFPQDSFIWGPGAV